MAIIAMFVGDSNDLSARGVRRRGHYKARAARVASTAAAARGESIATFIAKHVMFAA